MLSFRPKTRHFSIRNVYFVGASTHPGTGVPICLAGARITSEQILGDLDMEFPWPQFGTVPLSKADQAQVNYLDQKQIATGLPGGHGLVVLIAVLAGCFLTMYVQTS